MRDTDQPHTGFPFEQVLAEFPRRRILVVGDIMLDRFSYGHVRRVSPEAPTPLIHLDHVDEFVGGAGNVARNIAGLGANCDLVGIIGVDEAANAICRFLSGQKSIEPNLVQVSDRATTVKSRFVANLHNTHLLRADIEDASSIAAAVEDKIIRAAAHSMKNADVVLLSDYNKGVLSDRVISGIVEQAREAAKPVVVDPKGKRYERYRGVDFVTPNLTELGEAVGLSVDTEEHQIAAAHSLIERLGCRAVLVTRGEHGVLVVPAEGKAASFPATARRIVDVSGAGDTLVAGFALGVVSGASTANAARLANLAAGIVVAKYGTASASIQELKDLLLSRPDFHINSKIFVSIADLRQAVTSWREAGLSVGFTNGCFDLLHEGHIELLTEARAHCDRLIVALNSDASVRKLKGPTRPIQSQKARARIMAALGFVDAVTIFDEETPLQLISELLPNVLIKGADYRPDQVVGGSVVEEHGGRIVLVDLVPNSSTTGIVEKMKSNKSEALV